MLVCVRGAALAGALLFCGSAMGAVEPEDGPPPRPAVTGAVAVAEATPDTPRPEPRPARVPAVRYERAWLAGLPAASGGADWRCLTEALYFEARGEDVRGQFAVAEVILNRVESRRFPGSVCGVVRQGTGRKFACQFTYTCDGHPEIVRDRRSWARLGKIARLTLDGAPRALTHGALYYHTRAVSPVLVAQVLPHRQHRRAPLLQPRRPPRLELSARATWARDGDPAVR